jgi:hypothetical protein
MSGVFSSLSIKKSKDEFICRVILTPVNQPEIEISRRCKGDDMPNTLRYFADMIDQYADTKV